MIRTATPIQVVSKICSDNFKRRKMRCLIVGLRRTDTTHPSSILPSPTRVNMMDEEPGFGNLQSRVSDENVKPKKPSVCALTSVRVSDVRV